MRMERGLIAILASILGYGVSLAVINLASGLRVLDITGSKLLLSLTVLLYNIFYAIMSSIWTHVFSGRLSRATIVALSFFLVGSSAILMGLVDNATIIVLLNALLGMFMAVLAPVLTTVLTDYIGKDSIAITYMNITSSIGMLLGYILAIYLTSLLTTKYLLLIVGFTMTSLVGLTPLFPSQFKVIEGRKVSLISLVPHITGRLRAIPSVISHPNLVSNIRGLIIDLSKTLHYKFQRRMPLLVVGTSTLFTAIALFFTPMPAYLRDFGLSDSEIYALSLTSIVASTIAYRLIKNLIEDMDKSWRILLTSVGIRTLLFLTPTMILYLDYARVALLILYTLIGLSWAGISTSLMRLTLAYSENERRGERLGHLNTSISIGLIIGSIISGPLAESYGVLLTSITSSALVALSLYIYYKAMKALVT